MSNNKVTFGLEKVHLAFVDDLSKTKPAWKKPIPIPGAVRWTPEAQGDSSTFYADNTAYFVTTSNNGYTGELEMALLPDDVLAELLGWQIDNNGMLVELSEAIPKKFALLGQVQGDKRNRRFVFYDCQASRPSKERKTQAESVEVGTDVLSLTVSPIEINGQMVVKGDLELNTTNATAYNSFFESVYVPVFGTAGTGGDKK
ncbi:major tail protein [Paenibacillus larvae]